MVRIDLNEASYFFSRDHYVKGLTRSGKAIGNFRETLGHMEDLLSPYGFIRCHNRYLVNLRQISAVKSDSCILQTGEILPVSRRRSKETKEAFQRFVRDHL